MSNKLLIANVQSYFMQFLIYYIELKIKLFSMPDTCFKMATLRTDAFAHCENLVLKVFK